MASAYAVTEERGVLCIRVTAKKLGVSEGEELADLVFAADPKSDQPVLLDLNHVEYVSSSGISTLMRIAAAREHRIIGLSNVVKRTLEAIRFLDYLYVSDDRETALDELAP